MLKPISLKLDPPKKTTKWHHRISTSLKILFGFVAILWAIELIDLIPGLDLDGFGVRPRSAVGLIGILLMPFLHADLSHLTSNTLPLLILGGIVITVEKKKFILATVAIILLGGLGTWVFGGSNTNHIGASGLVYGYFGYVMTRAVMEKKIIWIITGIVVAILYGSLIWGIFPSQDQSVSWMGHLCGLLAGGWFGWRRTLHEKELEENPEDDADRIIKEIKDATKSLNKTVDGINKSNDDTQKTVNKIMQDINDAKQVIEKSPDIGDRLNQKISTPFEKFPKVIKTPTDPSSTIKETTDLSALANKINKDRNSKN